MVRRAGRRCRPACRAPRRSPSAPCACCCSFASPAIVSVSCPASSRRASCMQYSCMAGDLGEHLHEPVLDDLERHQRLAELDALLAVGQSARRRPPRRGRARPTRTSSGSSRAASRVLERVRPGQPGALGDAHVVERDVGLPDRARGALPRRSSRPRSPACRLDQEALDLTVLVPSAPTRRRRRRSSRCRSTAWRRRAPTRRRRGERVVSSATESEPWSGSVSANAPICSRRAMAGSQRSFCSSEPSRSIDFIASPDWTPRNVPRLPSPRLSSMWTRPRASGLMPGQP